MACKFKVGDRVRANKESNYRYNCTNARCNYTGTVIETDNRLIKIKGDCDKTPYGWLEDEYFDLIESTAELHITVKGRETIGVYKHDGKTDKAVAKCSPEDTFDFSTGVKLVCERLGVLPTSIEPVKTVEKLKYFTGRVICIQSNHEFWTKGKIYEVKDGEMCDDEGDPRRRMTLDELTDGLGLIRKPTKFIALVE